jgi:hypothetical protein
MESRNEVQSASRSALGILLPAALMAILPLGLSAGTQAAGAFSTDVSRAAVTTMPAYTVDESASTKTHTLFMGADIALNLDKDTYGVHDVWGSNWVIDINGRQREVSAREAPLNLKITPTLKLTESSATIVGFKRVQAYSYANDPSVLLTRGLSQAASINSDLLASAQNAQHVADTMSNHAMGGASVFAGADDQFSENALQTQAQYLYSNTHSTATNGGFGPSANSTAPTTTTSTAGNTVILAPTQDSQSILRAQFNNSTAMLNNGISQSTAATIGRQALNGDEPAGKMVTGGLDALDVEFDIRSAKTLHNPYVVTMTRFRPPNSRPGMVQNMVYAKSLHPIDEHLSHVHFVEEGFPYGYELLDFQLHIYNRGEEIATNVAADRVELTRDEAFEYIKSEYIGAHPKDTLPAVPAMAKLPSDLPAKLSQGRYSEAFYVKVTEDGLASEAYADAACTQRVNDAYLDTVVARIRFKPALNNGKPVAGVATLNLKKLPI